jgi:FG-GAP-like repeat
MAGRQNLLAGVLLLLSSLSSSASAATVGFQSAATYAVRPNPRAGASADVNGDGTIDLLIASYGDPPSNDDGGVNILLGNTDGMFQGAKNVVVGKNPCPLLYRSCLVPADLNNDGKLDLVVLNSNDTLSVSLGNGDGTFQAHADYAGGNGSTELRMGDVNGDHRADLIVLQSGAGSVGILLGNGDGTFQSHIDYPTGSSPSALAMLDVNGDATLDIVVAAGMGIETLLGNGDATFQSGVFCSCGAQSGGPNSAIAATGPIEAGDLNGDGMGDLAVLYFHSDLFHPSRNEMVLLGNGDATFQPIDTGFKASFVLPTSAAIADFNGDGHLDLAVAVSGVTSVLLANGDGTFQAPSTFNVGSADDSTSVAARNIDGDNSPDLIVANGMDNSVSVLLNNTGADFSISASAPSPVTVSRGQSSTSTVTLTHQNTFDNPVELSCSVQPTQSALTCTIDPISVTFDASGKAIATLTISAGATRAALGPSISHYGVHPLQLLWLQSAGLVFIGSTLQRRRFKSSILIGVIFSVLLAGVLIFQAGCGGEIPGSQSYTVTVTGTSESTQHSATAALTVQ